VSASYLLMLNWTIMPVTRNMYRGMADKSWRISWNWLERKNFTLRL